MRRKHQKKNSIWIVPLLAIVFIVGGILLLYRNRPTFKLKTDVVTVEAGSTFDPLDYLASDRQKVEVSGNVQTDIPATYQIVYTQGKSSKTCTVTVRDTVSPVVTPVAEPIEFKCGDPVEGEALVTVRDETAVTYRLDPGDNNFSVPGTYTVTVAVTDAGGNCTACDVTLHFTAVDTQGPRISGVANTTLYIGDAFDPLKNVTVTDDTDPDPKLDIDSKTLNLKKAGIYTVTYTATDASGNQTTVRRKITVGEKPKASETKQPQSTKYTPPGGKYGWDAKGIRNQPYLVAVNRAKCTVTVYGKDSDGNYTVPVKAMACSVGREGHATPTGRYTTSTRYEWRLMVDGSYGRYAIRINGSIMFHSVCYEKRDKTRLEYEEYNKLGSPASLGCIRLCVRDIKWLYDHCPNAFPVIIYDDSAVAGPLGKPASLKIDINNTANRGWDPTDWDPQNPWKE